MAEQVIKSQGSEIFFNDPASGGGVTKVVCATSFDGLGGARDQIDTTCLDNTGDRTFAGGLGNPGQVTIPFNVHRNEISHEVLMQLKDSGVTVSWGIYSPDSATPPTVDSSGDLQRVSGRLSAIFSGYVADYTISVATNDIWKGTITIQRSGNVDLKLMLP